MKIIENELIIRFEDWDRSKKHVTIKLNYLNHLSYLDLNYFYKKYLKLLYEEHDYKMFN